MKDKKRELGSIIHEVIWQYCYGGGNTDSLFNYQDIDKATDEIVELFFQPESEIAQLEAEAEKEVSDEVLTKESLYIERIKNLQAIIRHCDSPASDNPRFEMVLDLTKRDKELALAINLMSSQAQKDKKSDDSIKPTADIDELRDELIAFCCECNIELPRDKDYIDLVDGYLKKR